MRTESYCGPGATPADWLLSWNADPVVIGALGIAVLASFLRGPDKNRWPFALGCGCLAIAFLSPLCALSAALFSARVAHHVLLTALAAPLFASAMPWVRTPGLVASTLLHAAIVWIWHVPALYEAALFDDALYWLMQGSFFGSAVLFWRAILSAPAIAGVVALLAFMAQMSLLGALLSFAPSALYTPHLATTWAWGLSPLQDQQLGGLLMWAPASALYLLAAIALLRRGVFRPFAAAA